MIKDKLTLLCKKYVEKKDYENALAIIDAIALVSPGRADAMYRAAFRRSIRQVVSDCFTMLRGSK